MTAVSDPLHHIHVLWDELADFDVTRIEEARNHLLGRTCEIIGACNATWVGAVRLGEPQPADPVKGWRPRLIRHLLPNSCIAELASEQARMLEAGDIDETTVVNVRGAGRFRVSRLTELAPEGWFEGAYFRAFYLGAGHHDAIWAGVPINEDAESYFGFYRGLDSPPFTEAEKLVVGQALRGLRWFHRQQFLGEGLLVASAPLTPLERRVLHGLLQGKANGEIATALDQSEHTTREYVKRLLRKYGVRSRTALMALWLGQPIP